MEDGGTPNAFATFALLAFLPFGIALFFVARAPIAALIVFLASFMFLPEVVSLDLPGVPGIGKQEIAALVALAGIALSAPRRLTELRPWKIPELFVVLLAIGDVGTALTNGDPIGHGDTVVLPGLTLHEAYSVIFWDITHVFVPFFVGRALFRSGRDLRALLQALVLAGALYTPLLFIELMMSPQLNLWVYGFHQHEFLQTIRAGGYRPMVFMPHGLVVGLFMCWSSLSALVLFRTKRKVLGFPAFVAGGWVFAFLVAVKSLGATIYAGAMAPIVWFLRPRTITRLGALIALVVISYPVLRMTGAFPEKALVDAAQSVAGEDRAQSLQYRFDNEALLMDHARERPLFGWGRFQRNMVFDDTTGRAVSVSDGQWIVTFSQCGAWGFACLFALILAPIVSAWRRMDRIVHREDRILIAGVSALVVVGAVDLLPNALQNSFTLFLCGALWGAVHWLAPPPARRGR